MSYEYYDVSSLKRSLESWKFLLLPVNNLLEWEHRYAPILIIALDSFFFGLLMYYNPSMLTTVSILGLCVLMIESVVPLVTGYLFKTSEWHPVSESKYTRICERIANFQIHVINARIRLETIRREKQPLYFLIVFFFLIFCAYVGQCVDNFLLTYFAVLLITLTPGARRHRLIPNFIRRVKYTLGVGQTKAGSVTTTTKRINLTHSTPSSEQTSSFSSSIEINKNK